MAAVWSQENQAQIERLRGRYPSQRALTLPALWLAQKQFGYISNEVAELVANTLQLSVREVREVTSFYVLFHEKPVGKHVIWMCRNLSCVLRGYPEIKEHLEHKLKIHEGETTADGKFTLLSNECLGACGGAPMIQIDDQFYEDLTPERIDQILDQLARETR